MGKTKPTQKAPNSAGSSTNRRTGSIAKRPKVNLMKKFLTAVPGEHNHKVGANIFDMLSTDSEIDEEKRCTTKARRPPPIIVTKTDGDIKDLLATIGISKFSLKFISIGIKVFLEDDNDYNKVSSALKEKSLEFFTHSTKDNKVLKVVLSGLPNLPIETIKEELALLNISPREVFLMSSRNPSVHRALYLLHLNASELTMQDLNKVKTIYHTVVKWNKYMPKSRGPTQCRNCSMYGHGTQNCHRKPSCMLCASSAHNQTNCPLKNLDKDTAPVYKCSFCINHNITPTNHRASDPSCPGKIVYTESRKRSSTFQRNAKSNQTKSTINVINKKAFVDAPIPAPLTRTFSSVTSGFTDYMNQEKSNTGSDQNETDESLFSTAELLQIFTSAINQIKNCKTKLDQIQVIANLISHVI